MNHQTDPKKSPEVPLGEEEFEARKWKFHQDWANFVMEQWKKNHPTMIKEEPHPSEEEKLIDINNKGHINEQGYMLPFSSQKEDQTFGQLVKSVLDQTKSQVDTEFKLFMQEYPGLAPWRQLKVGAYDIIWRMMKTTLNMLVQFSTREVLHGPSRYPLPNPEKSTDEFWNLQKRFTSKNIHKDLQMLVTVFVHSCSNLRFKVESPILKALMNEVLKAFEPVFTLSIKLYEHGFRFRSCEHLFRAFYVLRDQEPSQVWRRFWWFGLDLQFPMTPLTFTLAQHQVDTCNVFLTSPTDFKYSTRWMGQKLLISNCQMLTHYFQNPATIDELFGVSGFMKTMFDRIGRFPKMLDKFNESFTEGLNIYNYSPRSSVKSYWFCEPSKQIPSLQQVIAAKQRFDESGLPPIPWSPTDVLPVQEGAHDDLRKDAHDFELEKSPKRIGSASDSDSDVGSHVVFGAKEIISGPYKRIKVDQPRRKSVPVAHKQHSFTESIATLYERSLKSSRCEFAINFLRVNKISKQTSPQDAYDFLNSEDMQQLKEINYDVYMVVVQFFAGIGIQKEF